MNELSKSVTGKEYEKEYFPFGGFLFVSKDLAPKQIGKIILTEKIREDHSRFTSTGVIVSKSLFAQFEDPHETYMFQHLKRGDRVGFGTTVPLYSPSPPHYVFEGDDKERYITLHVKDVLCVICETEDKKIEYAERFK